MKEFMNTIWGSGQSRGFKLGAWALAIGLFGAYEFTKSRWQAPPPKITRIKGQSKKP